MVKEYFNNSIISIQIEICKIKYRITVIYNTMKVHILLSYFYVDLVKVCKCFKIRTPAIIIGYLTEEHE